MNNSGFAQTFLKLQKHIENAKIGIRWIDQDLGQLEMGDDRPVTAFPAVLLDFGAAQYTNLSAMVQWVEFNISIRLAFAPFSSANNLAPDVSKAKALEYYNIEDKLYQCLAGYTADDTIQPMVRISAVTERREDTYRVREIMFTTAAEDEAAKLPVNMTEAMLQIASELQEQLDD